MPRKIMILLLYWCASGFAAGVEAVYYFVDERGVPHFSNVPVDPRYKPMDSTSLVTEPPARERQPPPATALPLAPDEPEDPNDR